MAARSYWDNSEIERPIGKQTPGYHWVRTPEGMFCIQFDEPGEGLATVTWQPYDFPSKGAEFVLPRQLVEVLVDSIHTEIERPKAKASS